REWAHRQEWAHRGEWSHRRGYRWEWAHQREWARRGLAHREWVRRGLAMLDCWEWWGHWTNVSSCSRSPLAWPDVSALAPGSRYHPSPPLPALSL
ncbi:unnamed protein product, partial [Mycena citricolor]